MTEVILSRGGDAAVRLRATASGPLVPQLAAEVGAHEDSLRRGPLAGHEAGASLSGPHGLTVLAPPGPGPAVRAAAAAR